MSPQLAGRYAGLVPLVVGLGAAIAPGRLLQLYGIDPAQMTGAGRFGWRLFAVRNIAIGAMALRGSELAQDTTIAIQVPDQLVFLQAARSGDVPKLAAVLASLTSASVAITGLVARRAR